MRRKHIIIKPQSWTKPYGASGLMLYMKPESPRSLPCVPDVNFLSPSPEKESSWVPSPPLGSPLWLLTALLARKFPIQKLWESWAWSKVTWPGAWRLSNNLAELLGLGKLLHSFGLIFFLICKMGILMPNLLYCYKDINCHVPGLVHSMRSKCRDVRAEHVWLQS